MDNIAFLPRLCTVSASGILQRLSFAFLALLAGAAHATVKQPNGEYQDAMDDLSVKVPGGYAKVTRTWQADDLNKGQFRWYFNPAWADLQFTYDAIDGSVKQITRSGSQFTKAGTGVFVFDQNYFIQQTTNPAGWRWYDPSGNWISYDASGKITAYGDRNNVGVSFTRNADGTIHQLIDQNHQAVLTYQYSAGQLSGISDRSGRSVAYHYTGKQLTDVIDPLGYHWLYAYTGGLLTSKTDPEGHATTITYNGNRVVRITDPLGYQTNDSYSYDHFKRVYTTVETSPTNVRTETHYDANGKVIYRMIGNRVVSSLVKDGSTVEISIDERGLQTRTVYDTQRNPIETDQPDGTKTTATYDTASNQVTSRTDELGVQTTYAYDAKGNLTQVTEAVGKPEQRITTYTYDSLGQRLTQTIKGMAVPNGVTPGQNDTQYQDATTTWTYDAYGNIATISDPLNHTSTFTYDVMGNVLTKKDARAYTSTYTYNARGWLTSQRDPLNHGATIGYDKVGNRTTVVDALNHTTTYAYNANNWLTSITDALGGVSTTAYDKQGRVTQSCDQSSVCMSYGYDGDGRLTSTADGAGNITTQTYGTAANGLAGLLAATIYPTYTEQYKYDVRDRRVQTIKILPGTGGQPDQSQITAMGYDAKGQAISLTDPLGRTTLTQYDTLGRQIQVTDALAGVTKYTYDSRNDLLTVSDANGHTHRFTYDLAGHTSSEARPLGETINYIYDEVGNLTTRTNPKGERRVYTYDAVGRRVQEDQYPANSNTTSQSITYAYDERNQLTGYTQTGDTTSSATYVYDAKGQKTSETVTYGSGQNAFSKTIQYDYYPNGLKKYFTYPDNTVISYGYTVNNLLASATTPDGNTIQFTNFVWNTPTQIQLPGVVRNVTLDSLQRPLEIKAQAIGTGMASAPSGTIVMDYQYTYDAAGNITKRVTEDGEYDYTYDNLDRLTSAIPPANLQVSQINPNGLPVEQYTYDAVYNRISSAHQPGPWTYNANNQLLTYGVATNQISYTYDLNGNTSQQTAGDPNTPSNTRKLLYNAAERLIEVDDNGTAIATYQYDPLGRRIQKQVNGLITWYQYADEGLIAEYAQKGTLTRTYGWKPSGSWGTDPLWLANVNTVWTAHYYENDHLGTSQRLTEAAGVITWKAFSEAFGKIVVTATSMVDNSLRFPGQKFDAETNLHYNYFRDYEPRIGKYIEADPIGLKGGVNIFNYVKQHPVSNMDLLGLETCESGNCPDCPGGEWYGVALQGEASLKVMPQLGIQAGGLAFIGVMVCKSNPSINVPFVTGCGFAGPGKDLKSILHAAPGEAAGVGVAAFKCSGIRCREGNGGL